MLRRWSKLEKDFKMKNGRYNISKIPDIYDCIKYDVQHNSLLKLNDTMEIYRLSKALADIVIPQVTILFQFWIPSFAFGQISIKWIMRACINLFLKYFLVIVLICSCQEYGISQAEKLDIAKGYCTPLIRKIRSDLQRTQDDDTVNKLHPL